VHQLKPFFLLLYIFFEDVPPAVRPFLRARVCRYLPKKFEQMEFNFGIDGEIGAWGYSKSYVRGELNKYKNKPVTVRINSLGGSVDHGLAIAAQFANHGNVTAVLVGCVASAATIASLGAKRIIMDANGMYLAHQVSCWVDSWGQMNADEIEAEIKKLEKTKAENQKFDFVLGRMYAKRCGKDPNDIAQLMKAGQWMTADDVLKLGLIDEIQELGDTKADLTEKLNAMKLPPLPLKNNKWLNRLFSTSKSTTMNKNYSQVTALLHVDAVTIDGGKASLSEEQVGAIDAELLRLNDAHAAAQKECDQHKARIKELEEQIANLQKAPGADTNAHVDEQEDKELTPEAMFNEIKSLI
jgi:ATP-dependent protease ClpP protease subunit